MQYVVFPKTKSQTEQADDLMRQYSEEVAMSSRFSASTSVDEIERRLRNLKSDTSTPENRNEVNHSPTSQLNTPTNCDSLV